MAKAKFSNPFRPGAGHQPPYLAGRANETDEFKRLLTQDVILENMVITGLRGVGKTVLMETLKPIAIKSGWLWVGTDLSESASVSEENVVQRLITDLAVVTSNIAVGETAKSVGFHEELRAAKLDYRTMVQVFTQTPGLVSDKLKAILEFVWECLRAHQMKGIIFAYDESQNMSDHSQKEQYPLSLMLDCFQSIQRKNVPFMLVFAGLPTLFPKLVEARTFSKRMFRVVLLDRLHDQDSRDAIQKPIEDANCPVELSSHGVDSIVHASGGYPYFIQFICRETYDSYLQQLEAGTSHPSVAIPNIIRKLDSDFFSGRWARTTDRQRQLLEVVSSLPNCDREFTLQEVAKRSKELLEKPFSTSQISQMFLALAEAGLVYKNRHGKYSFAVPMLGQFIVRQKAESMFEDMTGDSD